MLREKSAGAIIFRRNGAPSKGETKANIKYLLLHYESGHWDFPRGHVERGETERQTAAREIEEETGIKKINFIDDFRHTISWFYRRKIGKRMIMSNKTAVLFLAETKVHQVKISDEHIDFAWLGFDDAVQRLTFPKSKKLMEKANDFLGNLTGNSQS